MFKKTALIAGLGLALSATAHAEYNAEANLGLSGGDLDGFVIGGTYYLGAVDDTKGPLREAAFLDMSSSVGIAYSESEFDDSDNQIDDIAVSGRFVFGAGNWIVDAGYLNTDAENGGEADTFTIGAGKYLTDATTLILSYGNIDVDDGDDADVYGIDLDHLLTMGDSSIKLHGGFSNAEADEGDGDVDFWTVDATWYPTNSLGLGVGYGNTDGDNVEVDTYRISAEWFINERVSASIAYTESDDDNSDAETDSFLVGISARF